VTVKKSKWLVLSVVLSVTLAACAAPTPEAMTDEAPEAMMEKTEAPAGDTTMEVTPEASMSEDEMMAETPSASEDAMAEPQAEAMMAAPEWFGAAMTDVNTGATFSLGDYKGLVVLVETMAVWCTNCLAQQRQVKDLHGQLGARDDFVSLGLDIDPNEDAGLLRDYTARQGFDWVYAVAPADVARGIANTYGDQFLNPPSTPMLIIDKQGEVHPLPFGLKSAGDLLAALAPFLNE
jgi:hypothetical protein